jgi:hypothetical protein
MRLTLLLIGLLFPSYLFAAVQAGTGLSSTTSGRMVPGVEFGLGTETWRASVSSIGVKNAYYYHSSYTASLFRTWKAGSLFWGEVESGLGGGLMYSERGFQDEGSTESQKKSDVVLGPAFFVQWFLVRPVYLKLDMLWGFRGLSPLIGLNGQDVIFLSLGLSVW